MTQAQIESVVTTHLWLAALGLAAGESRSCQQHFADAVEVINELRLASPTTN